MEFKNTEVWGFKHAIRGMRQPMNSHHKSDSGYCNELEFDCPKCVLSENCLMKRDGNQMFPFVIGENDMNLAQRLIKGGTEHRKFLRQIMVSVDITAPLFWWKEFDTYKIGTTANMLQNGTCINKVTIDKPHRLITATTIATQIITAVTSSQYGGATITLTHLAPFVRDSFNIYMKKYKSRGLSYQQCLEFSREDIKKEIADSVQTFNYQVNSMTTTNG